MTARWFGVGRERGRGLRCCLCRLALSAADRVRGQGPGPGVPPLGAGHIEWVTGADSEAPITCLHPADAYVLAETNGSLVGFSLFLVCVCVPCCSLHNNLVEGAQKNLMFLICVHSHSCNMLRTVGPDRCGASSLQTFIVVCHRCLSCH